MANPSLIFTAILLGLAIVASLTTPTVSLTTWILLTLYWAIRFIRRKTSLLGPLFHYELIRIGRNQFNLVLRVLYAALLLLSLWFGFRHLGGQLQYLETPNQLAWIGISLTENLLIFQLGAVFLLTPITVISSFIEERRKRTLEFLLASHLLDHEIIWGKLLARLLGIGFILLAALPVLALIQLWGGVSIYLVVAGFIITAITLLEVGCLSIYFSITKPTYFSAMVWTYVILFLCFSCLSVSSIFGPYINNPFSFLSSLNEYIYSGGNLITGFTFDFFTSVTANWQPLVITIALVGLYSLVHVSFGLFWVTLAVLELRRMTQRMQIKVSKKNPTYRIGSTIQFGHSPATKKTSRYRSSDIADNPIWWREVRVRIGSAQDVLSICYLFVCLQFFVFWIIFILKCHFQDRSWAVVFRFQGINESIRIMSAIFLTIPWVFLGFSLAPSFSREKEQRTLDNLFMLPDSRLELLKIKLWAGLFRIRWLLAPPLLLWLTSCYLALHEQAVLLLFIAAIIHLAYIANLGLLISLVSNSVLAARLKLATILMVQLFISWIVPPDRAMNFDLIFNPIYCWYTLAFPVNGLENYENNFQFYVLLGLILHSLLACIFLLWSCRLIQKKDMD